LITFGNRYNFDLGQLNSLLGGLPERAVPTGQRPHTAKDDNLFLNLSLATG
jgi:hypothetical protein